MSQVKQPNSKMCFVCGLQNPIGLHLHIYETAPGTVQSMYTAPEQFQGYPGVLHGGVVGAILDEISGRSQMGTDPTSPRFMFTAKLEIRYRQNVPIGQPLRIVGKAGRSRGRSAEAWSGIYLADGGELLAEARALLVDVDPGQFDTTRLEQLGWGIYTE